MPGAFDAHLTGCAECRTYVEELRQLRSLLMSDAPVAVPRDFDSQLRRRLDRVQRNPLQWWRFMTPRVAIPVAAMAVVAAAMVAVGPLKQRGDFPAGNEMVKVADTQMAQSNMGEAANVSMDAPSSSVGVTPSETVPSTPLSLIERGTEPGIEEIASGVRSVPFDQSQVMLRIHDELAGRERLFTIPTVLVGAEPVFASSRSAQAETENVY